MCVLSKTWKTFKNKLDWKSIIGIVHTGKARSYTAAMRVFYLSGSSDKFVTAHPYTLNMYEDESLVCYSTFWNKLRVDEWS